MPTNPTDDVIERAERLLLEPIVNRMGAGERACQLVIDLVVALRTARADTRRLDWLADCGCVLMWQDRDQEYLVVDASSRNVVSRGKTSREAIDAAIAAEEG